MSPALPAAVLYSRWSYSRGSRQFPKPAEENWTVVRLCANDHSFSTVPALPERPQDGGNPCANQGVFRSSVAKLGRISTLPNSSGDSIVTAPVENSAVRVCDLRHWAPCKRGTN